MRAVERARLVLWAQSLIQTSSNVTTFTESQHAHQNQFGGVCGSCVHGCTVLLYASDAAASDSRTLDYTLCYVLLRGARAMVCIGSDASTGMGVSE